MERRYGAKLARSSTWRADNFHIINCMHEFFAGTGCSNSTHSGQGIARVAQLGDGDSETVDSEVRRPTGHSGLGGIKPWRRAFGAAKSAGGHPVSGMESAQARLIATAAEAGCHFGEQQTGQDQKAGC